MLSLRWAWSSVVVVSVLGVSPRAVRAEPAVLYIPTEDVELQPTAIGDCAGFGSSDNSALGCTGAVDAPEVVPPFAGAATLREQLADALVAYDVHVTDVRPPEYLAYTMLLPSDEPEPRSQNFTCSYGGINCGARKRNDIVWVIGPTQNCTMPDLLLASIYAVGRASGLEGVSDPLDAMYYVPDYTMGTGTFVDACSPIVQQIGFDDMMMPVPLPLECTALDHAGCPAGQQNGHAELLAVYGPRTIDEDPPLLNDLQPSDGSVFAFGEEFTLDVDIVDADPVVGGRWTVSSSVLEDSFEGGVLTICTNDVCDFPFSEVEPLKPTDSDWGITFSGVPEGVYEVTFEAADFHGNVAQTPVMVVYVGEGPVGTSSGGSGSDDVGSGGPDSGDEAGFTTSTTGVTSMGTTIGSGPIDESSSGPPGDATTSGAPEDGDGLVPHGCTCKASDSGGGAGWWWAIAGLGGLLHRRRRAGPGVASMRWPGGPRVGRSSTQLRARP